MRIAIDAAGPEPDAGVVVDGALAALHRAQQHGRSLEMVLYGLAEQLRERIPQDVTDRITIVDAPDIITQEDKPSDILFSKTASSIIMGVKDMAAENVDAFVSMGHTGAVVAACRTYAGRIRWISKPAMGIPFPNENGMGFMLDVGASMDTKANHLVQFAAMGSTFVQRVYRVKNPRVGLLNIGTESTKGDELAKDAYRLFGRSLLNFVGNIEGSDIPLGKADVIVTSGFVGNILLKFAEMFPTVLVRRIDDKTMRRALLEKIREFDASRYGGATLLGVNGTVVVGHGRSDSKAVAKAIQWAGVMVQNKLTSALKESVFRTRRALWLSNPFSKGDSSEVES